MAPRSHHDACTYCIRAALAAANPTLAVHNALKDHPEIRPTALFATGKASIAMAIAAVDRLGPMPGVVSCVPEHEADHALPPQIAVLPADHPLPTQRNLHAADAVEQLARNLKETDTLLACISGGGSAHLASPAEGLTLTDLRDTTNALLRAGATINELNAVRKHCERLKGGNLARLASPATIYCLVISDVIGDHLDTISSGPFAPDQSTYASALNTLGSRGVTNQAVHAHLLRGAKGEPPETPKPGDPCFDRVAAHIIASNKVCVTAAAHAAEELRYAPIHVRADHTGAAADLGRELACIALEYQPDHPDDPAAIIVGGETTVDVQGASGLGGRNQEVALAAAIALEGTKNISLLSFGTDGIDGPTDAAGGLVDGDTATKIRHAGIDPQDALARHDSHTALHAADALIRTGPTGTNVNDIAVVIIDLD